MEDFIAALKSTYEREEEEQERLVEEEGAKTVRQLWLAKLCEDARIHTDKLIREGLISHEYSSKNKRKRAIWNNKKYAYIKHYYQ